MDWLAARIHHAEVVAGIRTNHDSPGEQVSRVKSAGGVDPQETVFIHVSDIEPNLIHVCGDQHRPGGFATSSLSSRISTADQGSEGIDLHLIEESVDLLFDDRSNPLLPAGDSGDLTETFEKVDVHGQDSPGVLGRGSGRNEAIG